MPPANKTRRVPPKLLKKWRGLNMAKLAAARQAWSRQQTFQTRRMSGKPKTKKSMPRVKREAVMMNNATRRSTRTRKTVHKFDPAAEEARQRQEQEIARGQAEMIAEERRRLQEERETINAQLANLTARISGLGKPKAEWVNATRLGRSGSR